jgi:hypothetical protein
MEEAKVGTGVVLPDFRYVLTNHQRALVSGNARRRIRLLGERPMPDLGWFEGGDRVSAAGARFRQGSR